MAMNIKIYQVRDDLDGRYDLVFMGYRKLEDIIKKDNNIPSDERINLRQYLLDYYELVYEYSEETDQTDESYVLDSIIWPKFNRGSGVKTPDDFKGHSLSVSDIVEIDGHLYFCDSLCWKDL